MNAKDTVMNMIENLSRKDWDKVSPESWDKVEDEASSLAVIAAEVAAYSLMRGGAGCGDHGHDEALKAAKKMWRKARKAVGYSYP